MKNHIKLLSLLLVFVIAIGAFGVLPAGALAAEKGAVRRGSAATGASPDEQAAEPGATPDEQPTEPGSTPDEQPTEPGATPDEQVTASGTTGDCSWTLCGTRLTISGSGKMGNYEYYRNTAPWGTGITEVTIEDGVTSIGNCAFNDCMELTSVTIPDSVTSIGGSAFDYCTALTSVDIPDSVTRINFAAFYNCERLTSIVIPDSVTRIGNQAFEGCTGLTSIVIGSSVSYIDNYVFSFCTELAHIEVSDGNTVYDSRNNCNAIIETSTGDLIAGCKNTVIPDTVTRIGFAAFLGCTGLTSINIPDAVTMIDYEAFCGCTGLTSIVIPDSVTSIDDWAFEGCSGLTNVVIGNSVTSIGEEAFYRCTGLTSIIIPDSVTNIRSGAFNDCERLVSVTVPESVTSIGEDAFGYYWDINTFKKVKVDGFTVYGHTGTAAEQYANKNGFTFIDPDYVDVASVSLNTTSISLIAGKTYTLKATVKPAGATVKAVTWSTGNSAVATVSAKGVVTAKSAGTAIITARSNNGKTAKCTVKVTPAVSAVKLSKTAVSLCYGKSYALKATVSPANATDKTVTWSSSDKAVATVSAKGVVTAKGAGAAIITARSGNGKTAKCTVKVILATPKISKLANTASGVKLTIGKVAGAVKFRVFCRTAKGKWAKLGDTTATTFLHKAASSGVKYTYTVACVDAAGKTLTSAYNTAGRSNTFIAAPSLPTLTNTKNGVKAAWKKVRGAVKYRVLIKSGTKWVKLADTKSTSYVHKAAKKGKIYTYTICCVDAKGKSLTGAYNTKGKSIKCIR